MCAMTTRQFLPLMLLSALALFGPTFPAAAQGTPNAAISPSLSFDDLIDQANQAYNEGDYDRAAQLFEAAYKKDPRPNILFNIGRIYESANAIEKAIEFYDRFLALPDAELSLRQQALARRKLLGELAEIRRKEAEPDELQAPVNQQIVRTERSAGPGPWIFIGLGAAGLVTSGVFAILTYDHDQTYEDENNNLQERLDAKDRGENTALVADIALGVGAASLLTGLIWAIAGSGGEDDAVGSWMPTPAVGRDRASVSWQVAF